MTEAEIVARLADLIAAVEVLQTKVADLESQVVAFEARAAMP